MTETKTRTPSDRANTFPWPPLLLAAAVAGAIALTRAMPLPWPGLNDAPAHWIGLGAGALGLGLIAYAMFTLRKHGTTLLPDGSATALVTDGPYWRFRNPIYLGEVLLLFAAAEISKSIWFVVAGLAFAVLVTVLQIIPEERHLEARFGDAYRDYKARTRRWI